MDLPNLIGTALGFGFASGLRFYAVVLTIAVGMHFHRLVLSPGLERLKALDNPIVLAIATVAFTVELFADKIPWVDSLWDAMHILIRPLGAAALMTTALGSADVDLVTRIGLATLSGVAALGGHSAKAGTRLLVNHRQEPLTNLSLSLGEDFLAFGLVLLTIAFPKFVISLGIGFFLLILIAFPKLFRLTRIECAALVSLFCGEPPWSETMPARYADYLDETFGLEGIRVWVRCAAGSGIGKLRHSIGYLCLTEDRLIFVARRLFKLRCYEIPLEKVERIRQRKRLLLNRLTIIRYGSRKQGFYFFKNTTHRLDELMTRIHQATTAGAKGTDMNFRRGLPEIRCLSPVFLGARVLLS